MSALVIGAGFMFVLFVGGYLADNWERINRR